MSRASSFYSDGDSLFTQPITRASSTTQYSEPAVTPVDSVYDRHCDIKGRKSSFQGSHNRTSEIRVATPEKTRVSQDKETSNSGGGGYDPEPYGPYFSLPPDPTSDNTPLQRRKTAKELIGRYESITSPNKAYPRTANGSPTHIQRSDLNNSYANEKKDKGRSPIRQSFRNLLSVFNKKRKSSVNEPRGLPISHSIPNARSQAAGPGKRPSPHLDIPLAPPIMKGNNKSDINVCNTPTSLYSGSILYLSKPMSPGMLPVWTNCTAVLHPKHILVTWHSWHGNPSTSMITFAQCTDVRSLALADLDNTERGLLPTEPGADFKVFELLFEGRAREKFAAHSVKDRAGWVSAIWDAILQNQERKSYIASPSPPEITNSLNSGHDTAVLIPSEPEVRSLHQDSVRTIKASLMFERALPALPEPEPVSPIRITLYDPPRPGTISSSTPTTLVPSMVASLRTPPGPASRSQSPSIRNLDQRSVVKQRLAQIERTSSAGSDASRVCTPTSLSSRTDRFSSTLKTPVSERLRLRGMELNRNGSTASYEEASIIDSYASSPTRASPMSAFSGRLTSIASTRQPSVMTRQSHISSANEHHSSALNNCRREVEDIFSPTSQYSVDAPPTIGLFAVALDSPTAPSKSSRLASPDVSRLPSVDFGAAVASKLAEASAQDRPSLPRHLQINSSQDTLASMPLQRESRIITPTKDSGSALGLTMHQEPVSARVDGATKQVLQNVERSTQRIEDQSQRHGEALGDVRARVDAVMDELRRRALESGSNGAPSNESSLDALKITEKLEELQGVLLNDMPELVKKIEELKALTAISASEGATVMRNVAPPTATEGAAPTKDPEEALAVPIDVAEMQTKLDGLLAICQALQGNQGQKSEGGEGSGEQSNGSQIQMIQELLEVVKGDQAQRVTQLEQQTDSVRYLNELNSWLEAFVNHGTSQIDNVLAGVQQLCQELGPIPGLQAASIPGEDGEEQLTEGTQRPAGSLLSDIRRLLIENKDREESAVVLQASVNGLVAAVQEDLRRNAESRNMLTTESIVGLIERQRQDQERMLRTLATDLSNDIRGERLRFVEAMKEATAINVQIHVEEFKKELTREVLLMTQEVGRLQRERQTLEQQIADLFAFYAKQKQAGELQHAVSQPGRQMNNGPSQNHLNVRRLPTMRRRPLPSPSPRPQSSMS